MSLESDSSYSSSEESGLLYKAYRRYCIRHQHFLDRATPHVTARWIFWCVALMCYAVRMIFIQGWYLVCYALAIYLLNGFVLFLTPKALVSDSYKDYEEDGLSLPTRANEEFRPFMRQLPELKFWLNTLRGILIAIFCTFFEIFDIPVFWPVLVIYFIFLFGITMNKQIRHMIKYRYVPFTHGKTRYVGKPGPGKLAVS